MKIYRNTFVVISFASLTINAFEKKSVKNRHFCATRAEFTLNSNNIVFQFMSKMKKSSKKFEFF